MSEIKYYEFHVLYCNEVYMNERSDKLQKDGWELAGSILVSNPDGHTTHTSVFIPFKRVTRTIIKNNNDD